MTTYTYDSNNNPLTETRSRTENQYLYTGEQFDGLLGDYYLRARYYSSDIGRFTQADSWMGRDNSPVTLHKFVYANMDPANMTDPSGYFAVGLSGIGGGLNIQGVLATTAIGGIGLASLADFGTTTADGGFSDRQKGLAVLAAMSGAGSKLLELVTSKVSENDNGRVVLYHGSSVDSLVALLNGAPLSTTTALERKYPRERTVLGFYLTPDISAASVFGQRRRGGVIQLSFTNAAFQAVRAGSIVQPIPPMGSSKQSLGVEIKVRPITFPLFDSLRDSGQITATPAGYKYMDKKYSSDDIILAKSNYSSVHVADISEIGFGKNLQTAVEKALEFAKMLVRNEISGDFKYLVFFEPFSDQYTLEDVEIVIDGGHRYIRLSSLDAVKKLLWRSGFVSVWINVYVASVSGGNVNIKFDLSSRFTEDSSAAYHIEEGIAPFHVLGPPVPEGFDLSSGEKYRI